MTRWLAIVAAVLAGLSAVQCCGSEGTASRILETRESIARIVVEVVKGGLRDVKLSKLWSGDAGRNVDAGWMRLAIDGRHQSGPIAWLAAADRSGFLRATEIHLDQAASRIAESRPRLFLDGRPRSGVFTWLASIDRVAGLATNRRSTGSLGYSYRLSVRGLDIRRTTFISDGHVLLTTDISGSMAGGRLTHVLLVIAADELGTHRGRNYARTTTRIVGTATGYSPIGERCRIVRRIAEREISDGLDRQLLAAIESGGRRWHEAGHVDLAGMARSFVDRLAGQTRLSIRRD